MNPALGAHPRVARHLPEQPVTLVTGDWKNLLYINPSIPPRNFLPLILFLPFWGRAVQALLVLPQQDLAASQEPAPARYSPLCPPAPSPQRRRVPSRPGPERPTAATARRSRHSPPRTSRDGTSRQLAARRSPSGSAAAAAPAAGTAVGDRPGGRPAR